jgi:16S rRNA G966 N2-methylase RsmD
MSDKYSPVKISESYAALVPKLATSDFESLKHSIREHGQHIPIIINGQGVILDGYHRFKACQELGKEPKIAVQHFRNEIEEQLFIIECNVNRRHLNSFQRAELALKAKPFLDQIAKQNSTSNLPTSNGKKGSKYLELGEKGVNQWIGRSIGLSHETVRKAEIILQSEDDDLKQRARRGLFTINQAYNKIKSFEKRIALLNESARSSLSAEEGKGLKLLQGDFVEQSNELPDSSVDLILTDPPYDEGSVPLYGKLARVASRLLKEGGSLMTYVSNFALPEILVNMLRDNGIKYQWTFAVTHQGGHQLIYQRKIFAEWKPLIWFIRGKKPPEGLLVKNVGDLIESQPPDKSLDNWAQSHVEAEFAINNLTLENQIVLDPFMGAGTFGVAAIKLKRQFIGIDIDPEKFELAKANLR